MQRLEVSGAVRPIYGSLGVKRLTQRNINRTLRVIIHDTIHIIQGAAKTT